MDILHSIQSWIEEREAVFAWMLGLSALTFVGSLISVPIVVVQMRTDFFTRGEPLELPRTPLRALRRLIKNALGAILLIAGVAMLIMPGQGLLTIALGISLVDFPGKRRLQLKLVRLRGVRDPINWIRKKWRKPPLNIPQR